DLAVLNPDRAILDEAERIARLLFESRNVAVDEQPIPHARRLRRAELLRSKHGWLAQPFRSGLDRSPGCAGRPDRRSTGRRLRYAGSLRSGSRPAARDA